MATRKALRAKVKNYKKHLSIQLYAGDTYIGWVQFEGDNLAFYGLPQEARCHKNSMVYIGLPTVEYTTRLRQTA